MLDIEFVFILYLKSIEHKQKLWPLGQAVKTPPFHGGIMGSNPVGVTKTPFGVFLFP